MFSIFAIYFMMLWPPYFLNVMRMVFGSKGSGMGGAVEKLFVPIYLLLGLCVVATWVAILAGLIHYLQHIHITVN